MVPVSSRTLALQKLTSTIRAKRYERMMKAHGIAPSATSIKNSSLPKVSQKEKSDCAHQTKKRKGDQFDEGAAEDDPESESYGYENGTGNAHIKRELGNNLETLQVIKQEPNQHQQQLEIENSHSIMQLPFHIDNRQDIYTARSSMYDPSSGFNTSADSGNVYGLCDQQAFLNIVEYPQVGIQQPVIQQSRVDYAGTSARNNGVYEHESILISD
jgi:hypothetical protein